ncbi:hypothetical protein [Cohnella sp. GCM10012308]
MTNDRHDGDEAGDEDEADAAAARQGMARTDLEYQVFAGLISLIKEN